MRTKKNYKTIWKLSALAFMFSLVACGPEKPKEEIPPVNNTPPEKTTPAIGYTIVKIHPHDSTSFTEGFLFHEGKLFESSGAPGEIPYTKSLFGIVDLNTGLVNKKAELNRNQYFGEGIAILNNMVYQLTYTNQVGFMYDAKTFQNKGQFGYQSKQGWGLTTDGKDLIMSDGGNALTFLDPKTFQPTKTILVSENNYAVDFLNELEYVNGFIYANIYTTNNIVKINAETGDIVGKMNLDEIATEARKIYPGSLELNGIAYNPDTKTFFVTGKMWTKTYELKLAE